MTCLRDERSLMTIQRLERTLAKVTEISLPPHRVILGDCAPLDVGELLPHYYSDQKPLRVSFTVQVSSLLLRKLMAWLRLRRTAVPDLLFERVVSMEKRRQ